MEHRFDSMAERGERLEQAEVWRAWVAALEENTLPADVIALLESDTHAIVARGARGAAALGGEDAVKRVHDAIARWAGISNENNAEAKWRGQAGLRALGRLGGPEALSALESFLQNDQWARYAADALGELGGEQAAAALLEALPRYARPIDPGLIWNDSRHRAPGTHVSDLPETDSRDRILATIYNIATALARISFSDPESLDKLRQHGNLIAAQIPLDVDGLVPYEEEPFQLVFRHLLEKSGMSDTIVEAAFAALGQPRPLSAADAERDRDTFRSAVMRGHDTPYELEADITGWTDLYLIVD